MFAETLGATRTAWLGRGIAGDDTHGHVDDVCRFVGPRTLVLCGEDDPADANYRALRENRERLEGARLPDGTKPEVVSLPMPAPLVFDGRRLPASHANFYVANAAVLVPTFNDLRDREALGILGELFTDRPVVGIHAVELVWGAGHLALPDPAAAAGSSLSRSRGFMPPSSYRSGVRRPRRPGVPLSKRSRPGRRGVATRSASRRRRGPPRAGIDSAVGARVSLTRARSRACGSMRGRIDGVVRRQLAPALLVVACAASVPAWEEGALPDRAGPSRPQAGASPQTPTAGAEDAPQPPPPTFPAEVDQVVVDVVVTDKKGHPVGGLTSEDLIVSEDGERQTVESFEAIELPAEPVPTELPPPRISVNTAPEARRGRLFVVVFDDMNLTPFRARDAKAAVASFLESGIREGDHVTLVATSGETWWTARMTSGREKLLEIVRRLEGLYVPDHSMERMTDWEAMRIHVHRDRNVAVRVYRRLAEHGVVLDRSSQSQVDPLTAMTEDPFVTSRASEVYYAARSRNRATLDVLERALNSLAGAPGRKSVILVSEGFIHDTTLEEFKQVNEASLRANAAVYFVNARGLEAMPAELTARFGPALPPVDLGFVFQETYEAVAGPESLASDSGGFTVRNTNDLDSGIQRIADETRIYYLLGYTPTNRARDGRFRRIDVKLRDGKGLEVRSRKGYYAAAADGRARPARAPGADPAFQTALDSPWADDSIPMRMTHYVGRENTPGKAFVLVATEVDIRGFELARVEVRHVGAIEFLLVVTHRESGEFFRYDQKVDMDMLPATLERLSRLWFSIVRDFELQPGDHQAKMVVREAATGRVGSVVHDFEVPPLEEFRVSTPILTDLYRPKADGGGVVPQVLARREFPKGSGLICQFEVFGTARDEAGMPRVAQGYEVRRSDGSVYADVPESPIQPTSLGALSRLVAFSLQDAAPGEYEIRLRFRDEVAGKRLELREPFTVVLPPPEGGGEAQPAGSAGRPR